MFPKLRNPQCSSSKNTFHILSCYICWRQYIPWFLHLSLIWSPLGSETPKMVQDWPPELPKPTEVPFDPTDFVWTGPPERHGEFGVHATCSTNQRDFPYGFHLNFGTDTRKSPDCGYELSDIRPILASHNFLPFQSLIWRKSTWLRARSRVLWVLLTIKWNRMAPTNHHRIRSRCEKLIEIELGLHDPTWSNASKAYFPQFPQ